MRGSILNIEKNKDLTEFSAYKIKSFCEVAYFPECENDLVELYRNNPDLDFTIIGNGNNILFAKEYYDRPFIIMNGNMNKFSIEENHICAEAGVTLLELSEAALKSNLTGLEAFYDIPSSVGGAIVMNAGNKNTEIKDVLTKVRYLSLEDFEIKEMSNSEIKFCYRSSFFQNNSNNIVLKAWFTLKHGNSSDIYNLMEKEKKIRWEKQPREYPNCGSVFKRPKNKFVGPMLDELNLKGFTIGGAQVSQKHSGFIVNTGSATGEDIILLINEIQRRVKLKFNIELEVEQRIIL